MRLTLIHNATAGGADHAAQDLVKLLENAGHRCKYQSTKEHGWKEALRMPGDMVVAAGGDGTVEKVGVAMAGRDVPIALLPLGTANNVAQALGLQGTLPELISAWPTSVLRPFDVGVADVPGKQFRFLEGAGLGFFPQWIEFAKQLPEAHELDQNRPLKFQTHRRLLQEFCHSAATHCCDLWLANQKICDEFLLLEAMNIRALGPKLAIAPTADPGDGLLDLVLVRADERDRLADYLQHDHQDNGGLTKLDVIQVPHLRIEWDGAFLHVDDKVHPQLPSTGRGAPRASVELRLEPGALQFLVPGQGSAVPATA